MRAASDPELKVYGIFGFPLGHTVSPAIQNCAFEYYKLKSIYFAFERPPARFRFLMRNLKSLVLDGFNVTVPFKENVVLSLDRLSPEAKTIGAVNTVKKEKGRWIGYNTDTYGFLAGLHAANFKSRGRSVLIFGAGGSARAVAYGLAKSGIREVFIANRTQARAQSLVNRFRKAFPKVQWSVSGLKGEKFQSALLKSELVVNCTKVGLKKSDRSLIAKNLFPKRKILVYDLIYKPRRTKLLSIASALGHKTVNGETMLLHQGAKAFEIWTGKSAPVQKMRKALQDALRS